MISNNTATSGGGIYAYNYSLFYIMGDHGIYSNGADEFGGGVCLKDNSFLTIYRFADVQSNSARYGGGVYVGYGSSFLQVEAETSITDNSATDGGGIYAYDNSWIRVSMGSFSITDNRADNFGGGVYLKSSYLTALWDFGMSVHEINIERNSARYGGGVYLENNSAVSVALTLEEVMKIAENSAVTGGGIYAYDNSRIILYGYNEISGNIADEFGGGVYLENNSVFEVTGSTGGRMDIINNSATNGGGLYSINSTVDSRLSTFVANTASSKGGGLYLESSLVKIFAGYFGKNTAVTAGGAIYTTKNAPQSFIEWSNFVENIVNGVNSYGEAICLEDSEDLRLEVLTFAENSASEGYGGSIAVKSCVDLLLETFEIAGSTAKYGGGAAILSSTFTFYDPDQVFGFYWNNADTSGGAIYADGSELHLVSTTVSGNATDGSGGGIYITQQTQLNVDAASTITSNNAAKDGGGIFTMDYSYRNPANIAKYANINAPDAAISNNTAGTLSSPPINKDLFNSRFNGNLLDNYNINYKIANVIFSVSNTVSGKYADLNSVFKYTITLSGMSEIPTYLDYRYNDGTTGTPDLTDGTAQFTLKNDQTIYFDEFPTAGTVQIQQNQLPGYSVSYSIDGNPEVESANLTLTLNDLPVTVFFEWRLDNAY